jgi:hypothetical protein
MRRHVVLQIEGHQKGGPTAVEARRRQAVAVVEGKLAEELLQASEMTTGIKFKTQKKRY